MKTRKEDEERVERTVYWPKKKHKKKLAKMAKMMTTRKKKFSPSSVLNELLDNNF